MTTPTPSPNMPTPEQVRTLLEGTTPGEWNTSRPDLDSYAVNPETDVLEHVVYVYRDPQERIGVFAGELNNARQDAALMAAAPALARAYLAALAAPQSPRFSLGQFVKKRGSKGQWHGRVCGSYSTAITPEGYAVESLLERGSVQIYPASALEPWDGADLYELAAAPAGGEG